MARNRVGSPGKCSISATAIAFIMAQYGWHKFAVVTDTAYSINRIFNSAVVAFVSQDFISESEV